MVGLVGVVGAIAWVTPAWSQPTDQGLENEEGALDVNAREKKRPESVEVDAEYRLQSIRVDPYELSGTSVGGTTWTEQRLRMNLRLKREKTVEVFVQVDALDGVLFGDNGLYARDPSPNSGVSLSVKRPNRTGLFVGLPDGGDPLDKKSYRPVLREIDPIEINFAYATAFLPVGILRVGRQPQNEGAALAAHDGGRYNRWGVSRFADTSDRILFGTKLDEAWRVATQGPDYKPSLDLNNGLFLAVAYDWLTQNPAWGGVGDARQLNFALLFRQEEADWGGLQWSDVTASSVVVRIFDDDFESRIWGFPQRLEFKANDFRLTSQMMIIRGETREISEGFAALASGNKEPQVQNLKAQGAQVIADYKLGPLTLTMEFDYASGDADPRSSGDVTSYSFARDLNVGLLMFEHILAFESARSVAVGVENLASLDADSFPITEIQTDGRFTNALALFPQLKLDIVDTLENKLHTRFGVLFAWPAADGVVDPILTTLQEDGDEIRDDAVNFHGGRPGSYYGTEFDLQIEWDFRKSFTWTIEAAYLLPGSSLQDEHGDAVPAYLLENRFVYTF
ncbi:MAG: hypothetical protein CMH57_15310 [Myxococcales bacterium]|nr:hypothetical protein [Myxococcales bacterium]